MIRRDEFTPISRDLWGVFFEDINYSADGGLYAELVQNRTFSYTERDSSRWNALTAWRPDGAVDVRTDAPLSDRTPTYVRLGDGALPGRIENEGFDGIRVVAGEQYRCIVLARAWQPTTLHVGLSASDGGRATALQLPGDGSWQRLETVLEPDFSAPDAILSVATDGPAVDVAMVSLFPVDVFHGEPNGLRRDLAEAIADLAPRFIRFPGGCVAHGLGLDNVYRWKDSIGPVELRVQDMNLWGYHQSRGLGYFEYFRFCEQIGATPLPILAAGVCCQNTIGGPQPVPKEQMGAYIQDVLDLVEFANGDVGTEWGRRRAELGHAEPFRLRYLGIGNEDQIDESFRDRFTRIVDAVHRAHPEVQVVGTAGPAPFGRDFDEGWALARETGVALVDEHSYKAPRWFFENLHRYDTYPRQGARVYLGEWGSRGNTMLNALAEAAYMTSLERNGDVVALASYAPLLARIGNTQWVPDLIYFDNERVLPSLNHAVQRLFARTAGDRVHVVEVQGAPGFERTAPSITRIALESSALRFACSALRIDGEPVGNLVLGEHGERVELPVQRDGADFDLELRITVNAGDEDRGWFAVHFGDLDGPDHWEWNFGTWLNRMLTLHRTSDGFRDEEAPGVPFHLRIGTEIDLRISVEKGGQLFTVTVDGKPVAQHSVVQVEEQRFAASCVTDGVTGATHLRVVNATAQTVELDLVGADGAQITVEGGEQLVTLLDAGAPFVAAPASVGPIPDTEQIVAPAGSILNLRLATGSSSRLETLRRGAGNE